MCAIQILVLLLSTFCAFEVNAAAATTKKVEKEAKPHVELPDEILDALRRKDNKTIIEWLDKAPENKNARVPSKLVPCIYVTSDSLLELIVRNRFDPNLELFRVLLERNVDIDEFLSPEQDLYNSPMFVAPLAEFMIQQGIATDNNIDKWLETTNRVIQRSLDWIHRKKARDYDYQQLKAAQAAEKLLLAEKERRAEYKKAEEVLINPKKPLIQKDVVTTNVKEFFEHPKGEQKIVHKIKKAIRKDDLNKLAELIGKKNEYIELKDKNGYTPLLQAVYTNKPKAVELLIKAGANRNATITAADGSKVDAKELAKVLGHDAVIAELNKPQGAVDKN